MIRFEQVSKTYPGGFHALQNVSFKISKGEMIFVAGHSGAGKSTVLKLIAGITKPTSGKVWMNNQDLGTLNDSRDTDRGWTVEMAIPIRSLRKNFRNTEGAKAGEVWRLNFSRVEWLHPEGPEENWVWSPCGEIAMHMPERWGYLCFLNEGEAPTLPTHHAERRLLWALYYAQEAHRARTGTFAASLAELGCTAADRATLTPDARLSIEATVSRFVLRVTLSDGRTLSLDERGQWDEQVP